MIMSCAVLDACNLPHACPQSYTPVFDAQNEQVQVEKDKLVVTAQGGSDATQQYAVEMNFFKEIKPEVGIVCVYC